MFSKLNDYKIRYTRTHLKNHHILHLINKAFLLRRAWDMHTVKLPPPKTLDPYRDFDSIFNCSSWSLTGSFIPGFCLVMLRNAACRKL